MSKARPAYVDTGHHYLPDLLVERDRARLAELEAVVAVVDEFAAAHLAYETMPPRPATGAFSRETVEWEQCRLEMGRRCYRANRAWSALIRERAALAGEGGGDEHH